MVLLAGTARADFGDPLVGLTAEQLARFTDGRDAFEEVEGVADGLGPVFNADSCAACHNVGATGGGSNLVETRFGTTTAGAFDPMVSHGGSLIQARGIGEQGACTFVGEEVPAEATIRAGRRTTPLFGLGLVDSVPSLELLALAAVQAQLQPATAGRTNIVTDVVTGRRAVGKFGWKSQVPNLLHFSGDAYLNEMGITSPLFPNENCPQGDCSLLACDPVADPEDDGTDVGRFNDFMRLLAPPPRPRLGWAELGGSIVFDRIGAVGFCAGGGNVWNMAVVLDELAAAVPFYGVPVPPVDALASVQAPVLAIYAETDRNLTMQMAPVMQSMLQRQKTFGFVVYQGVGHAFHNDTGAAYNAEAACDAWVRTIAWFNKHLRRPRS